MCNSWHETMLLVRASIYVRVHICTCTCAYTWLCMCIPAHTGNLWYETTSFWRRPAHKHTNCCDKHLHSGVYPHTHAHWQVVGRDIDAGKGAHQQTHTHTNTYALRVIHIRVHTCNLWDETVLLANAHTCTHANMYTTCYMFPCM